MVANYGIIPARPFRIHSQWFVGLVKRSLGLLPIGDFLELIATFLIVARFEELDEAMNALGESVSEPFDRKARMAAMANFKHSPGRRDIRAFLQLGMLNTQRANGCPVLIISLSKSNHKVAYKVHEIYNLTVVGFVLCQMACPSLVVLKLRKKSSL
ncbi:hypothetical protein Mapa_014592 [Marchantia paleacea]|nr:hypothetical protein Mapa_014592 [Marchantia paleacea]